MPTNTNTHEKLSIWRSAPHQERRRRRREEASRRQAGRIVLRIPAECPIVVVPSYLTLVQLNSPLFRIHKPSRAPDERGIVSQNNYTRYMLCVEPLESLRGDRSACNIPQTKKDRSLTVATDTNIHNTHNHHHYYSPL